MSKQIEAIFDFLCPYCYKGIGEFMDIIPDFPDVEVIWRPCESHPRPEFARQHSDLANAAFFYLRDAGGDLSAFINKVYKACFVDKKRIDDADLLASIASECGGDKDEAYKAVTDGRYADEVNKANIYAWDELKLNAVPSYICEGKKALSRGGILVPIGSVKKIME